MSRAHDITLVGTTFDTNTDDPKWWDYELEQGRFAAQIERKNSNILKLLIFLCVSKNSFSF